MLKYEQDGMGDYEKYIFCLQALFNGVGFEDELIGGEAGDYREDNVFDSEYDTNSEHTDDDDVAVEYNNVADINEEGGEEMGV
ncbi:hypothetical protein JTB14_033187 [Gonioctena quinquepunctata]|nr:hypothetical protein JTB14_033187 [Gonioctena quinquepunctata]